MTQQYQFFNRDLLEEACNLRLTGYPGAKMARKAAQDKIGKRA